MIPLFLIRTDIILVFPHGSIGYTIGSVNKGKRVTLKYISIKINRKHIVRTHNIFKIQLLIKTLRNSLSKEAS